MDDLNRAVRGSGWSYEYNRYSSDILGKFLNANNSLLDISPYSQIVAMIMLAIASVMLTYVFCDAKIRYIPLIMSTFIGLCPLAIECWLYKFDAPIMATSVLVCIIPFLFWNSLFTHSNKMQYIGGFALAFACLMIMWTSYQASNGIFLLMILGLAFNDWLKLHKTTQILKKATVYASAFLTSGLAFKFLLPSYTGWRDTKMFSFNELLVGVYQNIKRLLNVLISSLNTEWKVLFVLFFVVFFVSLLAFSERKGVTRLVDVLFGNVLALCMFPLSLGIFITLSSINIHARTFIGVGVVLSIIGILTINRIDKNWKTVFATPSIILLYSFIMFALAFGNGLADQERYGNFRVEALLTDLSHIYSTGEQVTKTTLQIQGNAGDSAVMKHVRAEYPVTKYIMRPWYGGIGEGSWIGYAKLVSYYNRPQEYVISKKTTKFDCDSMKTLLDTYYHTIKEGDDGKVCVIIK
jgi:hypothetical protein